MSEPEPKKVEWFQSLYVLTVVPGLLEVPETRSIVTVFSTNNLDTFSGRLRFYILHSYEQVSQMLSENAEYNLREEFLPYVEAAVKADFFPESSEGLPEAEMTEHTRLAAFAAFVTDLMMKESYKAQQATQEAAAALVWNGGEKAKA